MKIVTVIFVMAVVLFCATGSASADSGALLLSATSAASTDGDLSAAITASGSAGSDTVAYGGFDELDVFAMPAGSTCAATAESEDAELAYPGFDTSSYPGFTYVSGSYDQTISFDSGKTGTATYLLCGYLSYGSEDGETEAQSTLAVTLTAAPAPVTTTTVLSAPTTTAKPAPPVTRKPPETKSSPPKLITASLHIDLSQRKLQRGERVHIDLTGEISAPTPSTLPVEIRGYLATSCSGPNGYGFHFSAALNSAGHFGRNFLFRFPAHTYAGKFEVCGFVVKGRAVYARAITSLTYAGLPQPPPAPSPPPTQLDRAENAALAAAAQDFGGYPSDYDVFRCRQTAPTAWNCIVESLFSSSLGLQQATVKEINSHFYVGAFSSAQ